MASESDMLNIATLKAGHHPADGPAGQHADTPHAGTPRPADPVNHPEAARIARDRIAAAAEAGSVVHPDAIPAAPTADLVTDKAALKDKLESLGTVSKPRIPSAAKPLITAVGVFALVLLLFKSPVVISQVSYTLGAKPTPTPSAAPAASQIIPAENTITIPKINVHAPVVYEPSVQEAAIQKSLQDGVVHYGNTAVPGKNGNAAIFGHSSNDWWEPGNFKFVFVLLDKLAPGDQFTIDYQSRRYTYEVTGSKVVEPTDMSVLRQTTEPTVTLITCTPPGTSLRRLVVTAKQIDPAPNHVAAATPSTAPAAGEQKNLPSGTPGFFDQVGQAWDGIVHGFMSLFGADDSEDGTGATESSGQLPSVK